MGVVSSQNHGQIRDYLLRLLTENQAVSGLFEVTQIRKGSDLPLDEDLSVPLGSFPSGSQEGLSWGLGLSSLCADFQPLAKESIVPSLSKP